MFRTQGFRTLEVRYPCGLARSLHSGVDYLDAWDASVDDLDLSSSFKATALAIVTRFLSPEEARALFSTLPLLNIAIYFRHWAMWNDCGTIEKGGVGRGVLQGTENR